MIAQESLLVTLVQLVDRIPTPPPPPRRGQGRPKYYPDQLFLKALVISQRGPYPHTGPGVEVRRIFHELRSRAIENFNGQFKGIFDVYGQVPTKGLVNTRRFALGAILVYQLVLLYGFEHHMHLRVGLKAFLKAA